MTNLKLIYQYLGTEGAKRRCVPNSMLFYQHGILFSGNSPIAAIQGLRRVELHNYTPNLYITDPKNLAGNKTALKHLRLLKTALFDSSDYHMLYNVYLEQDLSEDTMLKEW